MSDEKVDDAIGEEDDFEFEMGDNPCGFCEGDLHHQCDADDCTCDCGGS